MLHTYTYITLHYLFAHSFLFNLFYFLPLYVSFLSVFHKYYHGPIVVNGSTEDLHRLGVMLHQTENGGSLPATMVLGTRERPILCLLLMLGTTWLGYVLFLIKRR